MTKMWSQEAKCQSGLSNLLPQPTGGGRTIDLILLL